MVDYGLKNKVALITGANNPWGIGAATALAFAREGAKVALVYKKKEKTVNKYQNTLVRIYRIAIQVHYIRAGAEQIQDRLSSFYE